MSQPIHKVCIAGAGAIGTTLGARLAQTAIDLSVFARGATLAAISEQGLQLDDLEGHHQAQVRASHDAHELGEQDLIFICTKAPAICSMLKAIQPMIADHTIVVPLVNGVPWWYFHGIANQSEQPLTSIDPNGEIDKLLPYQQVIGAVTFMTAHSITPGHSQSTNPHLLTLGELDHQLTERLEQVRHLVESAGIEARASQEIRDPLWTKIIANLTSNPLSVVTQATLKQIYSDPHLAHLTRQILNEVLLVAAAHGARVPFNPLQFMQMGAEMGDFKTSMLQDYQAKRPLELATIGDAVVELAQRMGLDMPATRHTLSLAHFLAAAQQR